MQRLFLSTAFLLCASASAQTTINITLPGSQGACTYTTGPVLSNSVPGQLAATATSATGSGCGGTGGGATFGPASPLAPTANPLTSNGGSVTLGFQVINATSCSGSITGASGGAFNSTFCSTAGGCAGAQPVTATFPANADPVNDNTYTITATCSGASGPPVSSLATVTVPHSGGGGNPGCTNAPVIASSTTGITNFSQQTANISVNSYGAGVHTADPTSFASVYKAAWPGTSGLIAQIALPTNKYLSEAFNVPNNYFNGAPPGLYGEYDISETGYAVPVSMTISTSCGDFSSPAASGSTVVSGCYLNKKSADAFIIWSVAGSCVLSNNTTYYLNLINADISAVTPGGGGTAASTKNTSKCNGSTCSVPIANGPNNWSSYVPPSP